MKSAPLRHSNSLDRRDFITGVTLGLTCAALRPSEILAAESGSAVKRYLYVTNDAERRVDIFDIGLGERGEPFRNRRPSPQTRWQDGERIES